MKIRAEELARIDEIKQWGYDRYEGFDEESKAETIKEYLHLAELCIAKEAYAYRIGAKEWSFAKYNDVTPFLQKHGYLPTELKAEGEDGK